MASSCEFSNYAPTYSDLPMEIILHIFRLLDFADLQAAGGTCSRWREALYDQEFHATTLVRFEKVCLSDNLPPAKFLLQCDRPFRYFKFDECSFGQVGELMDHIGQIATEVTFDNCELTEKLFYTMIGKLPHLRRLSVTRCSPMFMSGAFQENNDGRLINHLSLSQNQYLSDAILLRLTALIRSMETFDCSGCHISYHNAIHRRFYPNETTVSPSESVLTFKFIMYVLSLHRPHLRELNLSQTMISGHSLLALCNLDTVGLELHRLRLANCRQLNVNGIMQFLKTQPKLTLLDFSDVLCINDSCVATIISANPQMEDLSLAGCNSITNGGAELFGKLKNLRRLDISRCNGITTDGIKRGIARQKNRKLRELHMDHSQVCEEGMKSISHNCWGLRKLNVGHCVNGITDETVQCIIINLRWLRELSMEDCFRITDVALTGINVPPFQMKQPSGGSSSTLNNFHPPVANSLAERDCLNSSMQSIKISLRSKAEEEIVKDANRKRAMFAAYESNLIEGKHIEGVGIMNLRGLKVLNLKGCNKITDVSLKYGFKFLDLKKLSLSNCQQITLIGMETLVENCTALEELDLSDCYNISDGAIRVVTKLHRLRSLNISGCTQLTDHSLDAIIVNCKRLQTLSIFRCRRMYTDIEERLADLSTLRNLSMDNTGNMDHAEIFRLKKRFDY